MKPSMNRDATLITLLYAFVWFLSGASIRLRGAPVLLAVIGGAIGAAIVLFVSFVIVDMIWRPYNE